MIIYVDIDETICYREEKDLDYANSLPILPNIEKINGLYDQGHTIIYWTARGTKTGINWFNLTLKQFTDWGVKFHELRMNKPFYDLFIDDRVLNTKDLLELQFTQQT